MDVLAMLKWNLPRIRKVTPDMPDRLLVVSADDPMWRGGLSGPRSLFLHTDRPMISENGTSTLVHEMMHVANRLEAQQGADWIVEGLAEYYSLKIMWRSGTISDQRYERAFRSLERRGQEADRLDVDISRGPVTARAVGIMRKLDHEIYKRSRHEKSLDDVMLLLMKSGQKVSLQLLRRAAAECIGAPAEALGDDRLGMGDSRT
jgi:predicted metalloprotease with PDZ domain